MSESQTPNSGSTTAANRICSTRFCGAKAELEVSKGKLYHYTRIAWHTPVPRRKA